MHNPSLLLLASSQQAPVEGSENKKIGAVQIELRSRPFRGTEYRLG